MVEGIVKSMCDSVHFDKAVDLTGYGRFHYELFATCALSLISVGFQNNLAAYIFPAAQCELDLSTFQVGLLNVCFLVGGILSSFLWGILADFKGRRKILIFAHLMNSSLTLLCILIHSVYSIIFCRFLNGLFIGAPGSILFSYVAEFQPTRYRSPVICYLGFFFTVAWLLLPLLSWLILPIDIKFTFSILAISSWRLLMIILVVPEVLVGLWFMRLPESPKFFLASGDSRRALIILRKMFAANCRKDEKQFPVKKLSYTEQIPICDSVRCRGNTLKILQDICGLFANLFRPPLLIFTLLAISVMFTNMFGIFGLGWWLPELFVRFERYRILHPNQTFTVQELASLNTTNTQCKPSFEPAVIESTIVMGLACLVGNILSGWLAARIHIKFILTATMLTGSLTAFSIYWLNSGWQNLLIASIFQSAMVSANMIVGGVVVELFPTSVGAIAICLTMCSGRMGAMASNVVFGFFMDEHCEIPIFVVAIIVFIGAGICTLIPRKSEQKEWKVNEIHVAVVSRL